MIQKELVLWKSYLKSIRIQFLTKILAIEQHTVACLLLIIKILFPNGF